MGGEVPDFESRLQDALATAAVLRVLRSDEGSRTLAEWLMEVQEDPVMLELLIDELRRLGRRQLTD